MQIKIYKTIFQLLLISLVSLLLVWTISLSHDSSVEQKLQQQEEGPTVPHRTSLKKFVAQLFLSKIDWNNYTYLALEAKRSGPGEEGKAVVLEDPEESEAGQKSVNEYSYNAVASDKISLDRSVPDTRTKECKNFKYYENLPAVSVIIIFHDEHLSILLRTVHSIMNRTPAKLLTEIILVDDSSTKEFLHAELDQRIAETYPDKVRVLRLKERSGLMKARMAGIRDSKSDIVVVMDAHMEVNTNWLPPLIQPIFEDYRVATEPVVDYIDWGTMAYSPNRSNGGRGAFSWGLGYVGFPKHVKPGTLDTDPYENPIFLGAIMAINKTWFWELQGYDDQLRIWGGEQYDISFKVWRCGGKVLRVPCSHVGHNYKGGGHHPYTNNSTYLWHNLNRIAEIWFDDYKKVYYKATHSEKYETGDVSEQIKWKEDFGCKSFQWFLDNVMPDMLEIYPIVTPPSYAHGVIRNVAYPTYCVDTLNKDDQIGVYGCATSAIEPQDNQFFIYTFKKQIRHKHGYECWDIFREVPDGRTVDIRGCHDMGGHQEFKVDYVQQTIKTSDGRCLDLLYEKERKLLFTNCEPGKASQRWSWGYLNATAIDEKS